MRTQLLNFAADIALPVQRVDDIVLQDAELTTTTMMITTMLIIIMKTESTVIHGSDDASSPVVLCDKSSAYAKCHLVSELVGGGGCSAAS